MTKPFKSNSLPAIHAVLAHSLFSIGLTLVGCAIVSNLMFLAVWCGLILLVITAALFSHAMRQVTGKPQFLLGFAYGFVIFFSFMACAHLFLSDMSRPKGMEGVYFFILGFVIPMVAVDLARRLVKRCIWADFDAEWSGDRVDAAPESQFTGKDS